MNIPLLACLSVLMTSSAFAATITVVSSITRYEIGYVTTTVPDRVGQIGFYRIGGIGDGNDLQLAPGSPLPGPAVTVPGTAFGPYHFLGINHSGNSISYNHFAVTCRQPSFSCGPDTSVTRQLPPSYPSPGWDARYIFTPYASEGYTISPSSNVQVNGSGPNNAFRLATITYHNGVSTGLTYVYFTLSILSEDPAFNGQQFMGRIRLNANPNVAGQPEQSADFFTVEDVGGNVLANLGSVRVYDTNFCPVGAGSNCSTGSVDLYGYFGSLHLSSFQNPQGGAFLDSSVTPNLGGSGVPEPGTLAICGAGLLAVLALRRPASARK